MKNLFVLTLCFSRKGCLTALVSLCLCGNAFTQSLDSLIIEGLANNPQLKALSYKIESAGYRAESADNYPAPSLAVEFSQIPIDELNIVNKAISNSVSVSQMFPLGGKVGAMTEVENKNIKVVQKEYQEYRTSLIGQIKMQYYNLWISQRKKEIQQSNVDLLNNLIESTDILYQVNRVSHADLLTIRSELASNKAQLIILDNQIRTDIYKLNRLLGRELDSKEINTSKEISKDKTKYTIAELESILIENNPSLQKMNGMIDMNKAMITANNKELIPDLMLQGMVMRMPQGMILTSQTSLHELEGMPAETEYMYSLMASITLPFAPWSVNKYKAKEKELASGIRSIEYQKEDMKRDMLADLHEAYNKLKTAAELIDLYSDNVLPDYRNALQAQLTSYQNNQAAIASLIDSERMLLMQEMNLLMAKADYKMAEAEIEMMTGVQK